MTDADALLRAIVRAPDDDTARLVYADGLDEHGRAAEAEFIRVQCALAAGGPGDPEYPALADRDEELRLWLGTHVPAPAVALPGGLAVDAAFGWQQSHRGFPRFLTFDGDARPGVAAVRGLAAALAKAFDRLPTRWLAVHGLTVGQLAALLKQPVVGGLSHLTVQLAAGGGEAGDAARLLAGCRHLAGLKGLLVYFPLGDAGCAALAGGPWERLELFSAPGREVTAAGLRALAGAAWFRGLRELSLGDELPADALAALAGLPPLPRLHTLVLTFSHLPEVAWQVFARTRALPALTRLELGYGELGGGRFAAVAAATGFRPAVLGAAGCGIGPGAGAALAAAPWAGSLRCLDLSGNGLRPSDVNALAGSPALAGLRHLGLSYNAVGATGLAALASNPALSGLRGLRLGGAFESNRGLTREHFDRFLADLDMPDLRRLELSDRPVGPVAVRRLTDPKFASLRRLDLSGCGLTDAAVARLVAAPALQHLIELDLGRNNLRTGPEALADRAVLPQLASCALGGNPIPDALARKLRRRPGVLLPGGSRR